MKVFFIQSGFASQDGHYLLETRAWREAVLAEGLQWHGYANGALERDLAATEAVTPLFPHATQAVIDPDAVSRPITDLLYLSEQFASAAALMQDVEAGDLVIVQFATANEMYGLARWLNSIAQARRPRVAVLFHVPDPAWSYSRHDHAFSGSITLWRFAINQLRVALGAERIYLAAIDRRLAEFLKGFLNLPVDVTPLVSYFDAAVLNSPVNRRFDLLFAGGLRLEKGAPLLEQIIDRFEQQPRDRQLRIGLQLGSKADAAVAEATFRDSSNVQLDIAVGPLAPELYTERLTQSRVVVLPYLASWYASAAPVLQLKPLATAFRWWCLQIPGCRTACRKAMVQASPSSRCQPKASPVLHYRHCASMNNWCLRRAATLQAGANRTLLRQPCSASGKRCRSSRPGAALRPSSPSASALMCSAGDSAQHCWWATRAAPRARSG